jgi:hypothetical protein
MLAIRQIIEDPQDVIPIPPEFRHHRTEVIFMALEPETTALSPQKIPRSHWFDGYDAEKDSDVLESLPVDEASEEWEW